LEVLSEDDSKLSDDSGSGNQETALTRPTNVRYFIVDDTPPTVSITTPTQSALNLLNEISGNASDNLAGFNYAEIKISTGTGASERFWTGSAWSASETWLPTDWPNPSTSSWKFTIDQSMLIDDRVYTAVVRSYDYAGNVSQVYSTYTFTYDVTPPTYPLLILRIMPFIPVLKFQHL
jgi:hypothetical protein